MDRPENSGPWFAFEGVDGCGKSSTIQKLRLLLESMGYDVHVVCEPSHSSYWGRELRKRGRNMTPFQQLEYFLRDRFESMPHLLSKLEIAPGGDKPVVLQDRTFLSSVVYQGEPGRVHTAAERPHWQDIIKMHRWFFPVPDYIFLLNVAAWRALDRLEAKNAEKESFDPQSGEEMERRVNGYSLVQDSHWKDVLNLEPINANEEPSDVLLQLMYRIQPRLDEVYPQEE